jgi:hypothetical protein
MNEWNEVVQQHMPHLSKPQAQVLALWSFGMVMARSCGLSSVVFMISQLTGEKGANIRQRLREWCWDIKDKAGQKRSEVNVVESFGPLLRWVLQWWDPQEHRLALAMDASNLSDRFVVLAISVVYRGCAIPIAWQILPASKKREWKPVWLSLFAHFQKIIPADWVVLVLADRGLYADWLFAAIKKLGWHPFLRINANGKYRAEGSSQFLPMADLAHQVGCQWVGRATCFKNHSIQATLLVTWEAGYLHPWLVVTDLDPQQANIAWYSLRAWIECGFKHTKRAGWQWQATRMTDPRRAERLWLAIAVATLWVVSVGGEAEASGSASTLDPIPPATPTKRAHPRLLSCFRSGLLLILAHLLNHHPLPTGSFLLNHAYF